MDQANGSVRAGFLPLAALLGVGVLLEAGLVALILLVYRIPNSFNNIYGYSAITRTFFAAGWGLALPGAVTGASLRNWFSGLWLLLNVLWLGAFFLARRVTVTGGTLAALLALGLVFQLTLTLAMPPALSTDIYNYLAYGRMVALHGLNPYSALPSQLVGDPIRAFPMWNIVTHYGPVWIGLSAAVAWLAGPNGIFAALLLTKGLAALAHLAIAVLAYKLARGWQAEPLAGAVLLGACPLLLLEGAGNGHNDLLMMALALGGLLAFQRKRPWLGYGLLILSVMVKYVSALLVLFYLLAWLREQEGVRARLRLFGMAAAAGLLAFVVGYLPFWNGPATLLAGIGEESTHFILSPAAYLRGPLERLWSALSPGSGQAQQQALFTLNVLQKAGLLILLFFCARWLWLSAGDPLPRITAAWGVTALVYVGVLHNAIFPWYWIWPLATAGAEWFRPNQRRIAWFSGWLGLLAVLLYGIPF